MRVAFYAPMKPPGHPVPSGDRRMARLLMAALRAGGHRVVLASRLRSWDDGSRPGRQERIRARAAATARRLVARWRGAPDRPEAWFTYHLYHKAPDWLGPPVASALGLPYVVAEASYAAKRAAGPWAGGLAAVRAALERADAVIAMHNVDAAGLAPVVPPARLHRLAPFLDAAAFAAGPERRQAARRAWLGDDPGPWLLAVGMMRPGDKQRSYEVLAAALRRLAGRDWRLAVVGDGPAGDRIRPLFDAGRARFLGRVAPESMPAVYAAADLLVWPAVNEAYGMALLEAQAVGLAVVAGRAGGVPEIVADGDTGLLVPPEDDEAIAAAVARLLDRPGERQALGEAAARRVAARHDIAAAARRLDDILRGVRR